MLTGGRKRLNTTPSTCSVIYAGRLSLNFSRRSDKAATVTLFTLERSAGAIRAPIRPQSYPSYEFFQTWNSIFFTSANQRHSYGPGDPLSSPRPPPLSGSHTVLSLPLMETHANLVPPPASQRLMKLSMSHCKVLKMSREIRFREVKRPSRRI